MIAEKITEIIKSALDSNASVSLKKVEKLLEEANFDLQEYGVSQVRELLGQFEEDFELIENEGDVTVKCLKYKDSNKTQPIDEASLNRKIGGVIRKLMKETQGCERGVSLPLLGIELSAQQLKLPNGEKLSAYLRRFPALFYVWTDGVETYARNNQDNTPQPPTNNVPAAHKGFVSIYNISDFAFFQDYKSMEKELAELASQDGWFILPNEQEKDRYLLLDYKIRSNFALLVNKQMTEGGNDIMMQPDKVKMRTGFTTPEGKVILAHFILNQQRDSVRWQNWVFDHFSIE